MPFIRECEKKNARGGQASDDNTAQKTTARIQTHAHNTGRFIMYSGITKMYYRNTAGHVFTKPVQIEGTTQFFSPPVSCFSSQFTFLPLGDASVCSEKMAAPGEKSFCVFVYHTSKSVVTVQRTQSTIAT